MISACQYLTRAEGPADFHPIHGDEPQTVLIRGGSCIVDPLGNVLVEPDFSGEAIKLAEIDLRVVARGKYDLDVTGHYGRPDVFKLSVDTRSKPVVEFASDPTMPNAHAG